MTATTLTPQNAAAAIKGWGGFVVQPVSNMDKGLALGLYGPGGIGKTTLAATITDSIHAPRALLLNARGNPHVIGSYADKIDVIDISKYDEQEKIRQQVLKDGANFPYQSVIFDNVSEVFYRRLTELYGPIADITWQKHSATTADMLQLVRNWMDLTEGGPKINVIFVFQEVPETRTIRGQEVPSRSEIAANKALQSQIPTIINFMGRLYQMEDTPPYRRMLDFRPVESVHQAKFQVDMTDPVTKEIPMEVWDPSLASLLDTIRYHKPWPTSKHLKTKPKA